MATSLHHKRILDQVQASIRALALPSIADANVVVLMTPHNYERYVTTYPRILISAAPGSETVEAGTSGSEDIGYPVTIAVLDAGNLDEQSASVEKWLNWRHLIWDHFVHRRLPGISECYDVRIEPGLIVDTAMWFRRNVFATLLTLRVMMRIRRREGE